VFSAASADIFRRPVKTAFVCSFHSKLQADAFFVRARVDAAGHVFFRKRQKITTMKKILYILPLLIALSCGDRTTSNENNDDSNTEESTSESSGDVEKNSGANISPQLEDSVDRFTVDSLNSASEIQKEKGKELD
jgi:hypothetical protein